MSYCNKCGKKNDDDAEYCTKCGNYISKDSSLEKNIDKYAEEFGKKAERFGKHLEKKAQEFGKSMEQTFNPESKSCADCGAELKSDALYCWKCGNKIE